VQARGRHARGQQAHVQGDHQHDALSIVAVGRHEHRRMRQAGMLLDLGHVLVVQAQAVDLKRHGAGRACAFMILEPGPTPA
jgi:hypothetical protein